MFSIYHQAKQLIKKILPPALLRMIRKMKGEKMRKINLQLLGLIRAKNKAYLTEAKRLEEELLLELGLNDERLYEFPKELYPYTGGGLFYWQYPNQFSKYLVELSRHTIESYL